MGTAVSDLHKSRPPLPSTMRTKTLSGPMTLERRPDQTRQICVIDLFKGLGYHTVYLYVLHFFDLFRP